MYTIDLNKFSLDEFYSLVTEIELLPSRKILLQSIDEVMRILKEKGISTLAELIDLLKNKEKYGILSEELGVSEKYLTVLNREIKSYIPKPVSLEKLDCVEREDLTRLKKAGIKNTKELYEKAGRMTERNILCSETGINPEKVKLLLEQADLLRINGIGPVYASVLQKMGITSAQRYLDTPAEEILSKYNSITSRDDVPNTTLGIQDVEYCYRFIKKLDHDIEW